jgi:hypothetical protein
VGIGPADPDVNPFLRAELATLTEMVGGRLPTLGEPTVAGPRGHAFPLEATLDVPGTPQSGTGQAALLTGESTAQIYGRHFGPWTPVRLRPIVEEQSFLKRARTAGVRAAFANAYPRGWPGPRGGKRIAGPPLAARGAGLLDRHEDELANGRAVSSEIVNDGWREGLGYRQVPDVSEEEAGANLAAIANGADLTLYAHYATDTAGHRKEMEAAVGALLRVDRFLRGVTGALEDDILVFIASDHGNLEDVRAGHTLHPALGVAWGPGAERVARVRDLRDVAPVLLEFLHSG